MIAEAATQLDALSARVKELEAECFRLAADTCHAGYGDEYGHHRCREVDEANARATRAEQERDRLVETAERHLQTLNDNGIGSHTEAVVLVADLRRQLKLAQQERGDIRDCPAMTCDERAVEAAQTRKASLIETVTSTAIGFVVSLFLTAAVMPAFGYPTTWTHDFWITVIFTVASIVRGYFVRRSFETGLWRRWFNR